MAFEKVICQINHVHVFKIPPETVTAKGYNAATWKEHEFWNGRLKLIQIDNQCFLVLEDPKTLQEFARTNVTDSKAIQSSLDSTRYFAIRLEKNGRQAFVGLGFDERSDAFDFTAALQDFRKDLTRDQEVEIMKKRHNENREDLALKEGETIEVNFSVKSKSGGTRTNRLPTNESGAPKFNFASGFGKSSGTSTGTDRRRVRSNPSS